MITAQGHSLSDPRAEIGVINAVLSFGPSMLTRPEIARLRAEHFTEPNAADAWREIMQQKENFDFITLSAELRIAGLPAEWLNDCLWDESNPFLWKEYSNIVWNLARRRSAEQLISKLGAALFNGSFESALKEVIAGLIRVQKAGEK